MTRSGIDWWLKRLAFSYYYFQKVVISWVGNLRNWTFLEEDLSFLLWRKEFLFVFVFKSGGFFSILPLPKSPLSAVLNLVTGEFLLCWRQWEMIILHTLVLNCRWGLAPIYNGIRSTLKMNSSSSSVMFLNFSLYCLSY